MPTYPVHTIESAPEQSKKALQQLHQRFKVIPNIAATMASSPILLNGFLALFERVHSSSLNEQQIQTLLLTNAVTNASKWPIAFHTALALNEGVPPADVEAIRNRALPNEAKLAALSSLARTLIEHRGHVSQAEKQSFLKAGFNPEQILEVIAVIAASTITNYASSITNPPLEVQFEAFAWQAAPAS